MKKRRPRDIERSSGDSDSQIMNDDEEDHTSRLPKLQNKTEQIPSGVEADSESQGSGSKGSEDRKTKNKTELEAAASGPVREDAPEVLSY